jgi:hypothetical protein
MTVKGITLICQFTKRLEDHWVCTGSYIVDMYAVEKQMAPCGCECHGTDEQLKERGLINAES